MYIVKDFRSRFFFLGTAPYVITILAYRRDSSWRPPPMSILARILIIILVTLQVEGHLRSLD